MSSDQTVVVYTRNGLLHKEVITQKLGLARGVNYPNPAAWLAWSQSLTPELLQTKYKQFEWNITYYKTTLVRMILKLGQPSTYILANVYPWAAKSETNTIQLCAPDSITNSLLQIPSTDADVLPTLSNSTGRLPCELVPVIYNTWNTVQPQIDIKYFLGIFPSTVEICWTLLSPTSKEAQHAKKYCRSKFVPNDPVNLYDAISAFMTVFTPTLSSKE